MHFYCEKLYLCPEAGPGGLILPWSAEYVKGLGGGENLAEEVQPPTSHQLAPWNGPFHNLCVHAYNCFRRAKMIGIL